jgi:hypothetical protein
LGDGRVPARALWFASPVLAMAMVIATSLVGAAIIATNSQG